MVVKTTRSLDPYVDEARYSRVVIPVSAAPLSTNITSISCHCWSKNASCTWLGVIRACTFGIGGNKLANNGQEGRSRSSGNIGVHGWPVQQKFGRTGSIWDGYHQWCLPQMVEGIWIGTCFQEVINKVEVGHVAREACPVQRRHTLWDRYSVDVGAVLNEFFFLRG
jgi:hypothetical protein